MKQGKILLIIATILIPLLAFIESKLFYAVVERDFWYYLVVCSFELITAWGGYFLGKNDSKKLEGLNHSDRCEKD
jgi:hypothetical protein